MQAMVTCPACGTRAPDGTLICAACGHNYTTQFARASLFHLRCPPDQPHNGAPLAGGPVSDAQGQRHVPEAPKPPTFWQRFLDPLATEKYRAELQAYLVATGVITDVERREAARAVRFITILVACAVVAWIAYGVFSAVLEYRRLSAALDTVPTASERADTGALGSQR